MKDRLQDGIAKIRLLGTWRNTLRASGLVTMLWLIWTRDHPDPSALLICGAMIGLPSFVGGKDS